MEHPDPSSFENWEKENNQIDKDEQEKLNEFEKQEIKRNDTRWKEAAKDFADRKEKQVDAYFDILLEPFKIKGTLNDKGNEEQIQTIKNFFQVDVRGSNTVVPSIYGAAKLCTKPDNLFPERLARS